MNTRRKNARVREELRQLCPSLSALHIEVHRTERLRLEQALAHAGARSHNRLPAVVHRTNRSGWKITMSLPDFLRLCRPSADT